MEKMAEKKSNGRQWKANIMVDEKDFMDWTAVEKASLCVFACVCVYVCVCMCVCVLVGKVCECWWVYGWVNIHVKKCVRAEERARVSK